MNAHPQNAPVMQNVPIPLVRITAHVIRVTKAMAIKTVLVSESSNRPRIFHIKTVKQPYVCLGFDCLFLLSCRCSHVINS